VDRSGNHIRHASVFVGILSLHGLAIGALWIGLADSGVRNVQTILQIDVVPANKPNEPPPPLPTVNLTESRAVQVVALEFNVPIADDQAPPIQVTAMEEDLTAPPGPAAAPALPPVLPVPNVRPRPIYVPGGRDRYPAESIRASESGTPTITICISETGAVDSVKMSQSSGFPRLDQAALGIGKEARFRPARLDGKPVPSCVPYRIKFAIGSL
jgi:protein TonB